MKKFFIFAFTILFSFSLPLQAQWVTRDHRWPIRGPWMWSLPSELPELFYEFNGIDFGHAMIAETLLKTQDDEKVERARQEVLRFIFSSPKVPPDEEQIAPTFARMAWEAHKTFHWAHSFHRGLYDLFATDYIGDKDAAYQKILAEYLSKPEAITPLPLDHHGRLWNFPESKSFRDRYRKFNTQIWAYHWLQAAVYDIQLLGGVDQQRKLMPKVIEFYHNYLKNPPVEWQFMPMTAEAAPNFAKRYPEATHIFDNLHMLHDNIDDVLARPDLFPTLRAKRQRILEILQIYLHRNQLTNVSPFAEYRLDEHEHPMDMGPRPPSVQDVIGGPEVDRDKPHKHHGGHHDHH